MEFKKLDIKPEGTWLKRTFSSPHTRKTIIFIILGAIGGLLYYHFGEEKKIIEMSSGEIIKSMLAGGFLGFFITNSPCSRGKC